MAFSTTIAWFTVFIMVYGVIYFHTLMHRYKITDTSKFRATDLDIYDLKKSAYILISFVIFSAIALLSFGLGI